MAYAGHERGWDMACRMESGVGTWRTGGSDPGKEKAPREWTHGADESGLMAYFLASAMADMIIARVNRKQRKRYARTRNSSFMGSNHPENDKNRRASMRATAVGLYNASLRATCGRGTLKARAPDVVVNRFFVVDVDTFPFENGSG